MAQAYKDLRDYLRALENRGLLHRVKTPVSANLEICEITDRVTKAGGPALLFERVEGYQFPVVTNLFGTMERMCLALGVERLDDIGAEIKAMMKPPEVTGFWDKLKALPKLAEIGNFVPKSVGKGACQEVVMTDPDLTKIPVLTTWPGDAGPFITFPQVITRDPVTGQRNVGMYRLQVYDARTTGMHWHIHKHGAEHQRRLLQAGSGHSGAAKGQDRLQVAVAIGADPASMYAATAPLPGPIDEYLFAGFLRKAPVELVKCMTVDLEVPASAEFVLEGYVDPKEWRREGPFGDHTGFYSLADDYPVFHVTCVTHRKDAIYPATIVGKPVQEDLFMGKATERIFLPLLQINLPEVRDMCLPAEGTFHNCVIVSIDKRYPGHARKVINALWGLGLMMLTKMILVVDHDVDVQNLSEVAFQAFSNVDHKRDLVISEGPVDALDHAAPLAHYGGKLGVDATRKWASEGHPREWPEEIRMSPEVVQLVSKKWRDYGLDK